MYSYCEAEEKRKMEEEGQEAAAEEEEAASTFLSPILYLCKYILTYIYIVIYIYLYSSRLYSEPATDMKEYTHIYNNIYICENVCTQIQSLL